MTENTIHNILEDENERVEEEQKRQEKKLKKAEQRVTIS
jgi:hypothetical protein